MDGKTQYDRVITWTDGSPARDFRGTWSKVCKAAGVPNLPFHDLRRTAVRALRRAGVAEGVIMEIGGWKTRSIFERYAIFAQSDIKDALGKLEQQRQKVETEEAKEPDFDHSLAIVAQKRVRSGKLDKTGNIN
jgi:integrase